MGRKALIIGATGLIGKSLLKELLGNDQYEEVRILTRRPIGINHHKVKVQEINFDELDQHSQQFKVDDVFSCLGTTIKKAKTKEAFRKVDYDYTIAAAKLSEAHAKQFLTVTSIGASSDSPFFYSQVKGDVERALKSMEIKGIHIFRPSLLLGERNDFRFGEKLGEYISKLSKFIFVGPLRKYRAIYGSTVARAMVRTALKNQSGYFIYESDDVQKIGS